MSASRTFLFLLVGVMICSGCGGSDDPVAPNPKPTTTTNVSGSIASDATWSGTVRLTGDADIVVGADITVAAGTVFQSADGATLTVHGSLLVNGTTAKPVRMEPVTGATSWGGVVVESGGVATIHHVTGNSAATFLTCKAGALASTIDSATLSNLGQALDVSSQVTVEKCSINNLTTNAIVVGTDGDVTITDSVIYGAPGDLVIVNGGALNVSYTDIGSNAATQHGDIFVSSSTGLSVTYSNLAYATDAVSIGNTNGALFQYNNFVNNDVDVLDLGSNSGISMSDDYWDSGTPSLGAAFSITTPSPSPIATAGPRP